VPAPHGAQPTEVQLAPQPLAVTISSEFQTSSSVEEAVIGAGRAFPVSTTPHTPLGHTVSLSKFTSVLKAQKVSVTLVTAGGAMRSCQLSSFTA